MSVLHAIKAVAWSFVGIRKGSESQADMGRLDPLHIVAVALVAVVLFVGALALLVNWVAG